MQVRVVGTSVRGVRDYAEDGDQPFDVRVGPCSSDDARFDGMGFPNDAALTTLGFVNTHVRFPIVESLAPDAVHMSGKAITVRGTSLLANSTVRVGGGFPVSYWGAAEAAPYAWRWDNVTQSSAPYNRYEQDGPSLEWPNSTVCKVLEYYDLLDGPPWDNLPNVTGLFNFSWVSEREFAFVTPCVPQGDIGYKTVEIELTDGRASATPADVTSGIVDEAFQSRAELLVSDKCMGGDEFLIKGECRPCPPGAQCLPGGRIWPLQDYWNAGELSGFVARCEP